MTSKSRARAPLSSHPMFAAAIALWFAALFGMGSMALRAQTLEAAVRSFGIDLVIPAAAPPLGFTARLLIALLFALLGGLAGYVFASAARPRPLRYPTAGARHRERSGARSGAKVSKTSASAKSLLRRKGKASVEAGDNEDVARPDAALEPAPQRRRGLSNLNSAGPLDPFAAPIPPSVSAPSILNLGELDAVEPLGLSSGAPVDDLPEFWRDALAAPPQQDVAAALDPVAEPPAAPEPNLVPPFAAPFAPAQSPLFATAPVAADQAAASVEALFGSSMAAPIVAPAPEPVATPFAEPVPEPLAAPVVAPPAAFAAEPAHPPAPFAPAPAAFPPVTELPEFATDHVPPPAPPASSAEALAETPVAPTSNRLVPRAGTAAQVLRTAPLQSLGVVELVERFALALSARQERDGAAGELRRPHAAFGTEPEPAPVAPAQAVTPPLATESRVQPCPAPDTARQDLAEPPSQDLSPPASAAARPFDMPVMLRSLLPDSDADWGDEDDEEPVNLVMTLRSLTQAPAPTTTVPASLAAIGLTAAATVTGVTSVTAETSLEDDDAAVDLPDAADLAARQPERFSSLLDMKPVVRPAAADGVTAPVRLPGGSAIAEQAVTEEALRSALAALQRMSGAA